jgi:Ala-tRNA(Pro) deacylase
MNERIEKVLTFLEENGIKYKNHTHPPLPTIEMALEYWKVIDSTHCKNLFFRNHKGNRHYLVVFECHKELSIHTLEKSLRQGKLSFASQERMERCLGLLPGSVSPFGLINDTENHVHLFLDENLKRETSLSFHPNDNHATVVIPQQEFMRYLSIVGNSYEFIEMYDVPPCTV